jgi:hypothetical protein
MLIRAGSAGEPRAINLVRQQIRMEEEEQEERAAAAIA